MAIWITKNNIAYKYAEGVKTGKSYTFGNDISYMYFSAENIFWLGEGAYPNIKLHKIVNGVIELTITIYSDSIISIHGDSQGDIIVLGNHNYYRIRNGVIITNFDIGNSGNTMISGYVDKDDIFWVVCYMSPSKVIKVAKNATSYTTIVIDMTTTIAYVLNGISSDVDGLIHAFGAPGVTIISTSNAVTTISAPLRISSARCHCKDASGVLWAEYYSQLYTIKNGVKTSQATVPKNLAALTFNAGSLWGLCADGTLYKIANNNIIATYAVETGYQMYSDNDIGQPKIQTIPQLLGGVM